MLKLTLTAGLCLIFTSLDFSCHGKPTPTKPNPTVPENFCVGKEDGHYAASSYANHFYSCVSEQGYYQPCPHNLIFKENLQRCDWPTAATTPTIDSPATQTTTTTKPNPTVPENFCVGKEDGHYAASSYANHFYSCVSEQGYYQPCPHNLIFKENLQRCDWPTATPTPTIESPATQTTTTTKPNPTVPENFCVGKEDGHYAASSYANHFYSCVSEQGYYQPCPHNLIFNENLQRCDWPTPTPTPTIESPATQTTTTTMPENYCV
ncbi:chondroitin proteoglycan-2-like [Labrus bergylta]|uniref:chondroitin proteoglycan-2-like n=1 Tax=Labrus bergylta TaxID=56723 RepID=UPI0033144355